MMEKLLRHRGCHSLLKFGKLIIKLKITFISFDLFMQIHNFYHFFLSLFVLSLLVIAFDNEHFFSCYVNADMKMEKK